MRHLIGLAILIAWLAVLIGGYAFIALCVRRSGDNMEDTEL